MRRYQFKAFLNVCNAFYAVSSKTTYMRFMTGQNDLKVLFQLSIKKQNILLIHVFSFKLRDKRTNTRQVNKNKYTVCVDSWPVYYIVLETVSVVFSMHCVESTNAKLN